MAAFSDFEHVLLEPEQEALLRKLVEASRNVPREQRSKFYVAHTFGGTYLIHPGLPKEEKGPVYEGDYEALAREGLLSITYCSRGDPQLDVTPLGYKFFEYLNQRSESPAGNLEASSRQYVEATEFRRRHSISYEKWIAAERLLWGADSERQLTPIGHLCREALQAFATELVNINQPIEVDPDPSHDIARIMAVLKSRADVLGESKLDWLKALLGYWATVSGLVQRQEHGGQKEGQRLVWEDGRRVVFHALLVMYEVRRTLDFVG